MYVTAVQENVVASDPFWYNIYRPIFLEKLKEKRDDTDPIRHREEITIHEYLVAGVDICKNASRSEAQLFLENVKFELGHRDEPNIKSRSAFKYLMGILKDITGKQSVEDLHFFLDLRKAYYQSGENYMCEKLDRFLFNTLFFMSVDKHSWNGITIDQLCDARATFSSHAIERFYHDWVWSGDAMRSIPMSSRVAFCYRVKDPLGVIYPTHPLYSRTHPEPSKLGVASGEVTLAEKLSYMLSPFAGPIDKCEHGRDIYMRQQYMPEVSIDVIKADHTNMDEHTVVTESEIPVRKDQSKIINSLWAYQQSIRVHGLVHKFGDAAVFLKINTEKVQGQNICINVHKWLTASAVPSDQDYMQAWIIPGIPLVYSHSNDYMIQARLENAPSLSKIRFLPMSGVTPVDSCMHHNIVQQISENVCFAIRRRMT
jgi:hypothetical protein